MSATFRRRVFAAACLLGLGCAIILTAAVRSRIGVRGYGALLAVLGGASVFLLRSDIGGREPVATRVAQQVDRIMIGGAETSLLLDKLKQKIASGSQLEDQISVSAIR